MLNSCWDSMRYWRESMGARPGVKGIFVLLLGIMFVHLGCDERPEYIPTVARSASGKEEYVCHLEKTGDIFFSTISECRKASKLRLRLKGMGKCMAVTNDESVLALAIIPMGGPNPYGRFYLSRPHEIIFIDIGTFQERHRWKVEPPGMPKTDPDDADRVIQRFDDMAFSHNGKVLATYYWKPISNGGDQPTVTLWDVKSGKYIREFAVCDIDLFIKTPQPAGTDSCSMTFSPDGRLIALSGAWYTKHPISPQSGGFIQIWQIEDGEEKHFSTGSHGFLWNLCFDGTGSRLACWTWSKGSKGTSKADILVWNVPEGNLLLSKQVAGRVLGIVWDVKAEAFAVRLEDQTVQFIKP